MVAFPQNLTLKRRGRALRNKTRDQILERIKDLIKNLLERLMLEERKLYLEEHPTKGNGYYTRDLLTLFGPLEDLKVPWVREGDFHPKLLPVGAFGSISPFTLRR